MSPGITLEHVLLTTVKSDAFVPLKVPSGKSPDKPPTFCTVRMSAGAAVPTYSGVKLVLMLLTMKVAGTNGA